MFVSYLSRNLNTWLEDENEYPYFKQWWINHCFLYKVHNGLSYKPLGRNSSQFIQIPSHLKTPAVQNCRTLSNLFPILPNLFLKYPFKKRKKSDDFAQFGQ